MCRCSGGGEASERRVGGPPSSRCKQGVGHPDVCVLPAARFSVCESGVTGDVTYFFSRTQDSRLHGYAACSNCCGMELAPERFGGFILGTTAPEASARAWASRPRKWPLPRPCFRKWRCLGACHQRRWRQYRSRWPGTRTMQGLVRCSGTNAPLPLPAAAPSARSFSRILFHV